MAIGLTLLIMSAVLSGIFGIKKGVDAVEKTSKAKHVDEDAHDIFDKSRKNLEESRLTISNRLDELGKLKLNLWSNQLGKFVTLFERLKNIEIKGSAEIGEMKEIKESINEMKKISYNANEVLSGAVAALGAGALAGIASYGGAIMFASASTGTAISALSGAAAANATLAWFGGGSLASGGMGMAGGAYILGGVVVGPFLAIGGIIMDAQARKKLATAESNLARAKVAAAEMNTAAEICNGITKVCVLFINTISSLVERIDPVLVKFDEIIKQYEKTTWIRRLLIKIKRSNIRVDYKKLSLQDQKHIHFTVQIIQVLKGLLETPILTKDGALSQDYPKALENADKLLLEEPK